MLNINNNDYDTTATTVWHDSKHHHHLLLRHRCRPLERRLVQNRMRKNGERRTRNKMTIDSCRKQTKEIRIKKVIVVELGKIFVISGGQSL